VDIESFRTYCLSKKASSEGFPFGPDVLIFKVGKKMFASLSMEPPPRCNLKCDPERALDLRAQYPAITGGYHQNKKHWNSMALDQDLSVKLVKELIDHSYDLVVSNMTKAQRESL